MEPTPVHYYEILCLDDTGLQSSWLSHEKQMSGADLQALLDDAERGFSTAEMDEVREDQRELSLALMLAAQAMKTDRDILSRLEKQVNRGVTYSDMLGPLTQALCTRHGFKRLVPTAVVRLSANNPFLG
jgi:hypothetical protein